MTRFGKLLKEARTHARLSQPELAEKVDVDKSYISKMETGVFPPPSREVAVKLVGALGIINKIRRLFFFLAAYVAGDEDMQGLIVVEVDEEQAQGGGQPAIAGALGSGVGLDAILPHSRSGQQRTDTWSQQRDQTIKLLVAQIVAEGQLTLTPEQRMLAERLIEEHARAVCHVLATEQDQKRR
jgi:transcriptional regulator with XRE-family HTH domain